MPHVGEGPARRIADIRVVDLSDILFHGLQRRSGVLRRLQFADDLAEPAESARIEFLAGKEQNLVLFHQRAQFAPILRRELFQVHPAYPRPKVRIELLEFHGAAP